MIQHTQEFYETLTAISNHNLDMEHCVQTHSAILHALENMHQMELFGVQPPRAAAFVIGCGVGLF
jgi:hypothetical protein